MLKLLMSYRPTLPSSVVTNSIRSHVVTEKMSYVGSPLLRNCINWILYLQAHWSLRSLRGGGAYLAVGAGQRPR